jgi:type IV pilus assembly protein PilC
MLYQFTLVSPDGKRTKQTFEAKSVDRLKAVVNVNGNLAVDIKEAGSLSKEIEIGKVTNKDLALFCQQVESILKAGVPAVDALEMVANTTKSAKLKKTTISCVEKIRSGSSMSSAFMEYPEVYPLIMCQMVKAGEESGRLDEIYNRLGTQFEKSYKLHNTIKKALAYPKMIIVVVLIALVVVCTVVVPMFVEIFDSLGTDLPITTKMFIALSDLFTKYWWAALIGVVFFVTLWILFSRSDFGKHIIDIVKLKLPLFSNLETKTASANLARTLSTLLESGLDYPKALEIARDTMGNSIYKAGVEQIRLDVSNGYTLTQSLKKTELFPDLLESLLEIGEKTGNVEEMLNNSANYFEDEVETATLQLTSALQPIIIIFMGVFVGMLVYSIYSPMFSMYSSIG